VNGLSLCAGGAIGELGFRYILPDYRTIGYVDNDKYCQAIIRARIRDGILDDAAIFGDIREFNTRYASLYAGKVDWLSAGFPCQPFSVAGRQLGEADERNLWPATGEAISKIQPRYAFLENVPALISGGYFTTILSDLVEIGYDCEWDVVSAADVGAPHLRKRLWILAQPRHRTGRNIRLAQKRTEQKARRTIGSDPIGRSSQQSEAVADASKPGLSERERETVFGARGRKEGRAITERGGTLPDPNSDRRHQTRQCLAETGSNGAFRDGSWSTEPDVGRVAHGVAHRVDRLKALGNGWVPQVLERILQVRK